MAAPAPASLIRRTKRSSGSNGASQGLTAMALAPIDSAHPRPALTPASGPVASPGASYSRCRPSARARASASVPGLTFTATTGQLACNRRAAHINRGLPASIAAAFSPPNRTDRPPAITTPAMQPDGMLMRGSEVMIGRFSNHPRMAADASCAALYSAPCPPSKLRDRQPWPKAGSKCRMCPRHFWPF